MNTIINAIVRVVAADRTTESVSTGYLIEVPAMNAQLCAVTPDGRVILRMAWPNEYRLPLGSEVNIGFDY